MGPSWAPHLKPHRTAYHYDLRALTTQRQKQYLVTPDEVGRFFRDYAGGRVDDPSDPRGSGMRGAYPALWDRAPWTLPRLLYHRVGIFRTIVDLPADDIWAKGWDIDADDPALALDVRKLDERLGIKRAFRAATRLARRDGVALIRYRLRDATGDPAQEPRGVRDILRVEALSRDCIVRVHLDEDPESDTFEQPLYFELRSQAAADAYSRVPYAGVTTNPIPQQTVKVHRDRVLLVIQHPKEGRVDDGESVLSWILGDAQGHENVKWYAAEGFAQRNVPPLIVTIDKDLALDPDNNPADKAAIDNIDKKVAELVNGVAQKIRIGGATIEPLVGSERINPPGEYALLFRREVLAGARIPEREVTGDPAGALAAASWDVKRYFSRIENDRQDFATPLVRDEHYARLDRWGIFPGLLAKVRDIAWKPHLELSEQDAANVLETVSRAVQQFRTAEVPIPTEVGQLVTWPDEFDPSVIVPRAKPERPTPLAAPSPAEGAPVANRRAGRAGDPRREAQAELPHGLKEVGNRIEAALRGAYAAWREQVDAAVEGRRVAANRQRSFARRLLRKNAEPTPEDVQRAVVSIEFNDADLAQALQDALLEAGQLGLLRQWSELGMQGQVSAFVNSPRAMVIKQFAENFAAEKARQMSTALRNTVADTIAQGGGVAEVKTAITERFGVLENRSAIARTESMRGWNQGAAAAMQEAHVDAFEFIAYPGADDGDPEGPCNVADGQVFSLHDAAAIPPLHPNCRCTLSPVIPGDA